MINRNIQMKHKDDNNEQWENLFPITFNENVFNGEGIGLTKQLTDLQALLNNEIDTSINSLDTTLTTSMNQLDTELTNSMNNLDTALNNSLDRINTALQNSLTEIEQAKQNKSENIIYLADFEKLPNETDDEHINRALQTLDGSGFESWDDVSKNGTLVLEGKTYYLTGSIFLNEYQLLKGAGHATVLNMENYYRTIIELPKPANSYYNYGVTIEDMTLVGNGSNIGIELGESSHVTIRNVFIYDTGIGVQAKSTWLAHFDRVTVRNYKQRGEYGFKIDGGTSNTYTATWAQNVKKGYQMWTWYSTMNSPACDDFTEYAYDVGQTATLNSPGAEKGFLSDGGYVFGGWARGVTINSPMTLNVTSSGVNGNASVFFFRGTYATVNSYRHFGSVPLTNVRLAITENSASVTLDNPMNFTTDGKVPVLNKGNAVVLIREQQRLVSYRGSDDPFNVITFNGNVGN